MVDRTQLSKPLAIVGAAVAGMFTFQSVLAGGTIRVPDDQPTIQQAIDAARDGDTVLVAPGTYQEYLRIDGKTITLASRFLTSADPGDIESTIIDGGPDPEAEDRELIRVGKNVGPGMRIIGLTIQNAEDGIIPEAPLQILHNRFRDIGADAIDFEDSGGLCAYNDFENVGDDAIDLDGACAGIFEYNRISGMGDDGIEIRLQEYSGPPLTVVIRHNLIVGSEEDGIQLIDYPGVSPRTFWIENNVIAESAMAGIGCMPDGNTREDYTAHPLPERVHVINNTIIRNEYGISGGGNFVLLNNIIADNRKAGVLKMAGDSVSANNLLWQNQPDLQEAALDRSQMLFADPKLTAEYRPAMDGPARDAGVAVFSWPGGMVARSTDTYTGAAPDVGAFETHPK